MIINHKIKVLVAGIGGASLGTEIIKCLLDADNYIVFGCDISEFAYGHYLNGVSETFIVNQNRYIESVLDICLSNGIQAVIPGGEEPLALLIETEKEFKKNGIILASNSPSLISICSDKYQLCLRLKELRISIPYTISINNIDSFEDFKEICYPCIVKPSIGTGGSQFVFLADTQKEAILYLNFLLNNNKKPLVQEYIPLDEGEFTIGVLTLPNGQLFGSVVMRRIFHTKLSIMTKTDSGLISSGYSQGLIDEFPNIKEQAEIIASALGSTGPLNIQGRLRNGVLIPFEINPRFSASTYLRAKAGFNEVDVFLRNVLSNETPKTSPVRSGYYLRTFSETYINSCDIRK